MTELFIQLRAAYACRLYLVFDEVIQRKGILVKRRCGKRESILCAKLHLSLRLNSIHKFSQVLYDIQLFDSHFDGEA